MSYHKMTTISGHKAGYVEPTAPLLSNERWAEIEANRPYTVHVTLHGHWKEQSARNYGRRLGIIGTICVRHSTADLSGKGRGGLDRDFTVN